MVSLHEVLLSNSQISSSLPSHLVAVFVGATSGIGEISLKKFAEYTNEPRIYFVGRSQDAADRIVTQCKVLNPSGEYIFVQSDISLISNVDRVCQHIGGNEQSIDLLFLSAGVPAVNRSVTSENIHLLAALNYYSRLRFITNFLPLLQSAGSLRRVVTIGGGTQEGPLDTTDFPALRVPLPQLKGHLSSLITLGLEAVARTALEVSFVHDYPGTVKTPLLDGMPKEMLKNLVLIPLEECGERHVYLATSGRFSALKGMCKTVTSRNNSDKALGTTGEVGSGVYSVGAYCESASIEVQELLAGFREVGMVSQVWQHTQGEFRRIIKAEHT
ncbi:hypothetical protein BGZ60DRAFT_495872 [Tricladium varicosporioides]|nr:hypothetical protein BGZ60DRAFT_495872 [Hymenoscyphus varicosporioides]